MFSIFAVVKQTVVKRRVKRTVPRPFMKWAGGKGQVLPALRAAMPEQTRSWGGWCREGVWTPLDRRVATPFVTRETWSKLGARAPRRIAQTQDAVFNGVLARLRPTSTGAIDFVVELVEGRVDSQGSVLDWQGVEVKLPAPIQRAYRFEGSIPAGHSGPIAVWGELSIELIDSDSDSGGSAAGVGAGAEALQRTRFRRPGHSGGGSRGNLSPEVQRSCDALYAAVSRCSSRAPSCE